MPTRGEVLVGIVNQPRDLEIAREKHWYRVPVESAEKWLSKRWPPRWVAFYQPKIFRDEAFSINYYAEVREVRTVLRKHLFPEEPQHDKTERRYYQVVLGPLQRLSEPIVSRRLRRIVFIPTTWAKFVAADEINDLYDESPLEDRLWAELKRLQINAERQEFVRVKGRDYALDFALYCVQGKLNLETDGDTWHADPQRIPLDNLRDNDLETAGWKLLRFNSKQINEEMAGYCLPTIVENVNKLGGLDDGRVVPRRIGLDGQGGEQLSLFDD
jgi:very-short-patch-repair endonuclease